MDTVGSGEHMGKGTDSTLFLHAGDQSTLELVRNEITALGIHTLGKRILYLISSAVLGANLSPECLVVGIRCSADLGIHFL